MKKIRRKHNIVERITFAFGLLLLAAILGFLFFDLTQDDHHPPQLEISCIYDPTVLPYGYRVMVKNTSKQTAEGAQIDFGLYQDGERTETASASFTFVAAKSKKTAWIVFNTKRKPSDSLVVISSTYLKP